MRHKVAGKQLSRNTAHRRAMRRNMARSLFQHEAIKTTEVKAKELRGFAERMITLAKSGTLHARRQVISEMGDGIMADDDGNILDLSVVQKLFDEIAPRYATRNGGYTRIIHLSERRIGDAGTQVLLQLVEADSKSSSGDGSSKRQRRAAKRIEAAKVEESDQAAKVEQPANETPAEEAPQSAEAEDKNPPSRNELGDVCREEHDQLRRPCLTAAIVIEREGMKTDESCVF